jgi:hypothetical protein
MRHMLVIAVLSGDCLELSGRPNDIGFKDKSLCHQDCSLLANTSRLSVAFRFYMSAANCGVLREVASGAIVESGHSVFTIVT